METWGEEDMMKIALARTLIIISTGIVLGACMSRFKLPFLAGVISFVLIFIILLKILELLGL